jgi:hypothetical protein
MFEIIVNRRTEFCRDAEQVAHPHLRMGKRENLERIEMSPDVEWQIGEDAERETVVKTVSRPPARHRRLLIGLMIVLGAGLGWAYSRLPDSPRLAAPAPTPTDTPLPLPPLAPMVDREAQAIAGGDLQTFLDLQDLTDAQWRQNQRASFQSWGRPRAGTPFFTILNSGVIQPNRGWADVIQYREGQYFRETRFYRAYRDSWVRTQPDLSGEFWGDTQIDRTAHFDLIYSARDADQARLVANQWEKTYAQVCSELGCTEDLATPPRLKIELVPRPANQFRAGRNGFGQDQGRGFYQGFGRNFGFGFGLEPGQSLTITLPSPSLSGLYYRTLDMSVPGNNTQVDGYFDRTVLPYLVYLASGGAERWNANRDGFLFVSAISNWISTQHSDRFAPQRAFNPNFLGQQSLLSLNELWSWPLDLTQVQRQLGQFEANALISFIDQTYGPGMVLKFFYGLREAQSLPHLIEMTGVPYNDFEAKWTDWLKQFGANS